MIIGIDIDDTLTYLHDIRIKTAERYIAQNNLPYKLVKTDTHLFSEMFDWPVDECDKFWFKEADRMLSKVKAREYASETIKNLIASGNKIIIITARTSEWHKDPYQLSYDWLTKNNIPFDKVLVGHLDKTQVCVEEKIDIFIDDMPNTLVKLQNIGIKTIMMKNPHNNSQHIYSGKIVNNWQEIEGYLIESKEISGLRL